MLEFNCNGHRLQHVKDRTMRIHNHFEHLQLLSRSTGLDSHSAGDLLESPVSLGYSVLSKYNISGARVLL